MSKMKFKGDITHTDKYTDKKTGEEKKKYTRLGALFERDDGSFTVKIFDSWLNVYPPKANNKDYKDLKDSISNQKPREQYEPDDSEVPF